MGVGHYSSGIGSSESLGEPRRPDGCRSFDHTDESYGCIHVHPTEKGNLKKTSCFNRLTFMYVYVRMCVVP